MLAASDIHIRTNVASKSRAVNIERFRRLLKFVEATRVKAVAIVGDLFDDIHIKLTEGEFVRLIKPIAASLGLLAGVDTFIYVPSSSSHDPIVDDAVSFTVNGVDVFIAPKYVEITLNGCRESVYLTHGDLAVRDGLLAGLIALLSRPLKYPLFEVLIRHRLNVNSDGWVVAGHSHLPIFNSRFRVANAGSLAKALPWGFASALYVACIDGALRILPVFAK